MKPFYFAHLFILILFFGACKKTDTSIIPDTSSSVPVNFSVQRTGTFVTQSSSPATSGTAQIGLDAAGAQWLKFNSDFITETTSGNAIVVLSKSVNYSENTVLAVSAISKNGEQYFKVSTPIGTEYSHIIIWCMAAKIPFGNAPLK